MPDYVDLAMMKAKMSTQSTETWCQQMADKYRNVMVPLSMFIERTATKDNPRDVWTEIMAAFDMVVIMPQAGRLYNHAGKWTEHPIATRTLNVLIDSYADYLVEVQRATVPSDQHITQESVNIGWKLERVESACPRSAHPRRILWASDRCPYYYKENLEKFPASYHVSPDVITNRPWRLGSMAQGMLYTALPATIRLVCPNDDTKGYVHALTALTVAPYYKGQDVCNDNINMTIRSNTAGPESHEIRHPWAYWEAENLSQDEEVTWDPTSWFHGTIYGSHQTSWIPPSHLTNTYRISGAHS